MPAPSSLRHPSTTTRSPSMPCPARGAAKDAPTERTRSLNQRCWQSARQSIQVNVCGPLVAFEMPIEMREPLPERRRLPVVGDDINVGLSIDRVLVQLRQDFLLGGGFAMLEVGRHEAP